MGVKSGSQNKISASLTKPTLINCAQKAFTDEIKSPKKILEFSSIFHV